MDKMADVLGRVGAWAGQNKYLGSIKDAFQNFMPLTIAGAIGVLWTNVLVNSSTGLGIFFKPIMALEFLNPAFAAIQFATISCITVGITFGISQEIGIRNMGADRAGYIPGLVGIAAWLTVTQTTWTNYALISGAKLVVGDDGALTTFTGISSGATGATGLFTGMIIGVLATEIFCKLSTVEALKIKMPEQVPPGVARAFEVLIPAFLTLVCTSLLGLMSVNFTGKYMNGVIQSLMAPIVAVGASLPGVLVIYTLIMLFWLIGIHGNNMLSAVKETLFTPLILENVEMFKSGVKATDKRMHIFGMAWLQAMGEFGGSGVTIGLVIAILLFSKREDNRAIGVLSVVPGLFNINETVTFGIPLVLNPILGIPFVVAPLITIITGYILTIIGFCPRGVLVVPWTTPPVLFGFLLTGGSIFGAITQLILVVETVVIYLPFLKAYERFQNKEAASEA